MLDANSPEIVEALAAWHEAGRASFERTYENLKYDEQANKYAQTRRKYIALDRHGSGVYLVDRVTTDVFTIKGYGVPNRRIGKLADVVAKWKSNPNAQWSAA